MKLRLALALCALATPLHAQSLPTPNLGTGTKLNGANLQNAATKATGTSVADPGTGALENLLPVQTFTGASHTFVAADLYRETRRSNSGSAMTDTFPGTSTAGLANGTMIQLNNADASASITVSAGTGTTLNGNASVTIPPNRSTKWVYDAPNSVWRTTMNSLSGVNGPASATSGNIATFNGTTGSVIQDSGKTPPSGAIVGTTDTQTLTNKSIDASEVNSGTLSGARLPAPTSTVLGGVKSSSAASNQFTIGVDTTGAVTYAQPGFSNLSGTFTAAQGPAQIPWTPSFTFGGGSTGMTFSARTGTCLQLSKTAICSFHVGFTAKGCSTGSAQLAGLPFTADSSGLGTLILSYYAGMSGMSPPMGRLVGGGTAAVLSLAGATAVSDLADTNFSNSTEIYGTVVYLTQ